MANRGVRFSGSNCSNDCWPPSANEKNSIDCNCLSCNTEQDLPSNRLNLGCLWFCQLILCSTIEPVPWVIQLFFDFFCCCCCACLSSCTNLSFWYRTVSDAKYWTSARFIALSRLLWGILTCLRFYWSNIPVEFSEFLSTEFAACSKPPSRDNHSKASYPRTQQRNQGTGWTQIMQSESS